MDGGSWLYVGDGCHNGRVGDVCYYGCNQLDGGDDDGDEAFFQYEARLHAIL